MLPFAALIVLVANARHLDRRLRVFAAAVASLSVWLVLEVAVFASQYSHRVEERNLFYLMPLFLIALLAWIERGQPRPPRATVAAAVVAAALPGVLPFSTLLGGVSSESDTIGLQPWWYVRDVMAGDASVPLIVVLVSLALGAAFLWLPRRYAPWLPVLVVAGFLATWLPLELWTTASVTRPSGLSTRASARATATGSTAAVGRRRNDVAVRLDDRRRTRSRSGRTSSSTAASTASTTSARRSREPRPCPRRRSTIDARDRRDPRRRQPFDAEYVLTDSADPAARHACRRATSDAAWCSSAYGRRCG